MGPDHPAIAIGIDNRAAMITPKHVNYRTLRSSAKFLRLLNYLVDVLNVFEMSLYRTIHGRERNDTRTVVLYRCFESLETGGYCVQSADFYHQGKATPNVEGQFIELLTERDPVQRSGDKEPSQAQLPLTIENSATWMVNCRKIPIALIDPEAPGR